MVRAVVRDVTSPQARRRQQWADAAGEHARDARRRRLDVLEARESQIRAGADLLIEERDAGIKVAEVTLRDGFIRRSGELLVAREVDPRLSPQRKAEFPGELQKARRAAKAVRPPLARLVNRNGWAVPLELSALAVASFRAEPGHRVDLTDVPNVGPASWSVLVGDPARSEPARRHVTDALRRLRDEGLLGLPGLHGREYQRFDDWELWAEDGARERYSVPEQGLRVPVDFWLRGWALVLTPPEIATYFMMRSLARQYSVRHARIGVGVAPSRREQVFGITKGVYACANELEEFGLLERTTERQPGTPGADPREVDRWKVRPGALNRDAFDTVTTVLREKPTPARMARFDPSSDLSDFLADLADTKAPAPGEAPPAAAEEGGTP